MTARIERGRWQDPPALNKLRCPGVAERGHGLTKSIIHAADCCDRWDAEHPGIAQQRQAAEREWASRNAAREAERDGAERQDKERGMEIEL
jgi:hypothetical protein